MRELLGILEREARTVDLPSGAFERLVRRRDRKQRARRITAAGVALILAVVAIGAAIHALTGAMRELPAVRPTQSPTQTAGSTPLPWEGPLKPGIYTFYGLPLQGELWVTFTVPRGWHTQEGEPGVLHGKESSARGMGVFFSNVHSVYADPCHFERGVVAFGPTVDDLATALANQPRHLGTTPTDVTLDGYAGKYVQLTVPQHLNLANCDSGEFRLWSNRGGGVVLQRPGQVDELWILNVPGAAVVVIAAYMPGTSAGDRAALHQIVGSVHIEVPPTPERRPIG